MFLIGLGVGLSLAALCAILHSPLVQVFLVAAALS